jgi:hypothetical protein
MTMRTTRTIQAMTLALLLMAAMSSALEAQTQRRVAAKTAPNDHEGLTVNTRKALKRVRETAALTERQKLRTRLRISPERAKVITTGARGRQKVLDFLAPGVGDTGYICTSAGCACFGDVDCNLMFTQVCSDPSTDGSCSGEPPVCTCHP